MGPRGAGKTLHGRTLAKKLGLFHIQFREFLQDQVIAKTKKRVVSEREEMQTAAEQDLPPEEPWVYPGGSSEGDQRGGHSHAPQSEVWLPLPP